MLYITTLLPFCSTATSRNCYPAMVAELSKALSQNRENALGPRLEFHSRYVIVWYRNGSAISPKSEPALELHSRAAPTAQSVLTQEEILEERG